MVLESNTASFGGVLQAESRNRRVAVHALTKLRHLKDLNESSGVKHFLSAAQR